MNKEDFFKEEIWFIKNKKIKDYAIEAINYLPEYFFSIPASSTLKYHPRYTSGEGGLVKHVKACVRFAVECFRMEWYSDFSSDQKDLILVSLLLHDGWKSGKIQQKYTIEDHAVVAVKQLKDNKKLSSMLPETYLAEIYNNITTHMGEWRYYRDTGVEFAPPPSTKAQKLVHFVDYTCSRKMFEVNFDAIPEKY